MPFNPCTSFFNFAAEPSVIHINCSLRRPRSLENKHGYALSSTERASIHVQLQLCKFTLVPLGAVDMHVGLEPCRVRCQSRRHVTSFFCVPASSSGVFGLPLAVKSSQSIIHVSPRQIDPHSSLLARVVSVAIPLPTNKCLLLQS